MSPSDFLLPALLGVLTFFLLSRGARRFAALRARDRQSPLSSPAGGGPGAAPPPATQAQVELHEQARELLARIDSKAAALEHLLRLATAEAQRLEEAIRRAEALAHEARTRR